MEPGTGLLLGSIISAGGSLWGNNMNAHSASVASHREYKYAKRLMNLQSQLNMANNEYWTFKAPSVQRAGLEQAGYNPILGINTDPGVSSLVSGSSVSASAPHFDNPGDDIVGLINAYQNSRLTDAQIALKKSQAEYFNSGTAKNLEEIKNPSSMWRIIHRYLGPESPFGPLVSSAAEKVIKWFTEPSESEKLWKKWQDVLKNNPNSTYNQINNYYDNPLYRQQSLPQ